MSQQTEVASQNSIDELMNQFNQQMAAPDTRVEATPDSEIHKNIDAATMTVEGLIKSCPYFSEMNKQNPEMANARAAEAIHDRQAYTPEMSRSEKFAAANKDRVQRNEPELKPQALQEIPSTSNISTEFEPAIAPRPAKEQQAVVTAQTEEADQIIPEVPVTARVQELASTIEQAKELTKVIEERMTVRADSIAQAERPIPMQTVRQHIGIQINGTPENPVASADIPKQAEATAVAVEQSVTSAEEVEDISEIVVVDETMPVEASVSAEKLTGPDLLVPTIIEANSEVIAETKEPPIVEALQTIKETKSEATPAVVELIESFIPTPEAVEQIDSPIVDEILQVAEILSVQKAKEIPDDPAIEASQYKLEELVVQLCEQLDIDYAHRDIDQFVALLQRPEFLQAISAARAIDQLDLEQLGTHEAKRRFGKMVSTMKRGIQLDINQLLGILVLQHATRV